MVTTIRGNSRRMPKTAIRMPTVRKIRCQYGFIFCRTVALTTALSKDSDTSRMARMATIPAIDGPPSIPATTIPTMVTAIGSRNSASTNPPLPRAIWPSRPVARKWRQATGRYEMRGASADVDAEVLSDALQARGVALADRAELPLTEAPVDLAEDHRGLGGGVFGEVVPGDLAVIGLVDDPDERVAHLAEVLLPLLGLVDADRERDLAALRRHGAEIDLDLLVVTFAAAGQVVAHVLDRTVRALQVVEEHEVAVGQDPAAHVEHDRRGVKVEIRAGCRARVPPEPDDDRGEARSLL